MPENKLAHQKNQEIYATDIVSQFSSPPGFVHELQQVHDPPRPGS
jgi:hypothetical protein